MNRQQDQDLEFLYQCTNEELEPLVKILTDSSNSDLRINKEYKAHQPNHKKYINHIIYDYQTFGGNSFANALRGGKGVVYKEILQDVCKQMKVNLSQNPSVEIMEKNLIEKITEEAIEKMSAEELEEFAKNIDAKTTKFNKQAVLQLVRIAIKKGGFTAYQLATTILASILSKIGLKAPFVVYSGLTSTIKVLSGPIGWVLTALWTAFDLAGPAYRITIPATIYMVTLKQKQLFEANNKQCIKCKTINDDNAKFCSECGETLN